MEHLGLRRLDGRSPSSASLSSTAGPGRTEPAARPRARGQSLVEFAISFPVVMAMILFGVDFGRVFVGWLSLTNAVREAANYASINPTAWSRSNDEAIAEYERLIAAEAGDTACELPATLPGPTFPNGDAVGEPAVVSISCRFSLITPLVSGILGDAIDVSASASFPIRSGLLGGSGFGPGLPNVTPGTGATTPPGPGGTAQPTITPFPTPSQLPTPSPLCTVPDLRDVNTSQATRRWTDGGFAASNLTFNPLVPPHFKIRIQSLAAGASTSCDSTMTVAP